MVCEYFVFTVCTLINLFTLFLGRLGPLSSKTVLCAHTFASNWQLHFLNQGNVENDSRNYFTINLYESYVAELGFELGTHANSVEPAQTLHTSASDQDSHCLPLIQHILNKSTGSKLDS